MQAAVISPRVVCSSVGSVRKKSYLTEEQRERLAKGPGLGDFVAGYAPETPEHLVRKKGQRYLSEDACMIKMCSVQVSLCWPPKTRNINSV